MRKEGRERGYTLVEVLVVTGIVALLAGISIAVSSPMRERARQASCSSQLRQLFVAVSLYSSDVDAGEEVPGLGAFSCAPARGPLTVLIPYAKSKALFYCPDVPSVLRGRMASSYVWMPVPPDLFKDPSAGDLALLEEQRRRIEAMGQQFPMWMCTVHDEMYYQPKEVRMDPVFQKPYVLEISVSGSLYAGRRPYVRGKPVTNMARHPGAVGERPPGS